MSHRDRDRDRIWGEQHEAERLRPARGIMYGLAICLPLWAAIAAAAFGYWTVAGIAAAAAVGVVWAALVGRR